MKLSTRTRYGMRAILELAMAYNSGPMQIRLIAEKQKISGKYLEQLVSIMKTAGLVRSIRGPKGGYMLSKRPSEIPLSEIFTILEGPVLTVECVKHKEICSNCADCITRDIWTKMNNAIMTVLEGRTLGDLIEQAKELN